MIKHILSDFDLTKKEVIEILNLSENIKQNPGAYIRTLEGKTLIMLFELASLRTRISFESGMTQLGGHAIFYGMEEGGFSRSETLEDGVKVLSRYSDCIMTRILRQEDMKRLGAAATVPVINGMTQKYHPCQNLADMLTIKENHGGLDGLKISYVGDGGCNTANSTMIGCASVGMDVTVVCPDVAEYSPHPDIVKKVKERSGKSILVNHDPLKGVEGAEIVYTDVWISAGREEEKAKRMKVFPPYQVNAELVSHADPNCIVMHCLPAHRGLEISSDIIDSKKSVVIDQAENRMHAQKGLLYWLLKK